MTTTSDFRAVYRSGAMYDELLPPHYYGGVEDTELVGAALRSHYGPPAGGPLQILELGCGTGRVTAQLAPYAARLVAMDNSTAMTTAVTTRFPQAETRCLDTREAVDLLLGEGAAGSFDVIGAFWSLSYPIGDCFEEMTADGIRPVADLAAGRERARQMIRGLIQLIAPGGHLLALFFDSETPEQRLVTRLWERVAPFPEGGRGYTRHLLVDELRAIEDRGQGWLAHTRRGGSAIAKDADAACAWLSHVHLKDFPALVNNADVQREIRQFVNQHTSATGEVVLPSGVHLIDFHVTRDSGRGPEPAP